MGLKAFGRDVTLSTVWDQEHGTYFKPRLWPETAELFIRSVEDTSPRAEGQVRPSDRMSIIDTGLLSSHPLLAGAIEDSIDFTGEGVEDRWGHGTVVALIVAVGMEYAKTKLRLLNAKVMDRRGNCRDEWIVAAIQWSVEREAKMINLSIGYDDESCFPDHASICEAIRQAEEEGCWTCVAGEARCPGECEGAIVIGGRLRNGSEISSAVAPEIIGQGAYEMVPL